ncbi:hypothetical protein [Brassicibacter mesophilus]|uniref:hypothetical protein n=1 Tax=Brassicibacter mesophilus TaxID=745119 RepID=UPI003D22D7C7
MTDKENNQLEHCTAFCPICGSDLYYLDGECYCKNKECSWSCGGCEKYKKL